MKHNIFILGIISVFLSCGQSNNSQRENNSSINPTTENSKQEQEKSQSSTSLSDQNLDELVGVYSIKEQGRLNEFLQIKINGQ